MNKIDSTFYFFQFVLCRLVMAAGIGFLIYSIVTVKKGGAIAACIFVLYGYYCSKKVFTKPAELNFDEEFLKFEGLKQPIAIKTIKTIENGVLILDLDGEILKVNLPKYYFIDKNFKQLKSLIDNTIQTPY